MKHLAFYSQTIKGLKIHRCFYRNPIQFLQCNPHWKMEKGHCVNLEKNKSVFLHKPYHVKSQRIITGFCSKTIPGLEKDINVFLLIPIPI